MKFTEIKISGLKEGNHQFQFDLDSTFLTAFSNDLFENPKVSVDIILIISEFVIKSSVAILGFVDLICDRSLDHFQYPVSVKTEHFFKFGEEEKELSDEIEVILKERVALDFDQLVYDFIALSLPSKRLHPRFDDQETDEESDGKIIFSTIHKTELEAEKELVDPRWSKLKELNV